MLYDTWLKYVLTSFSAYMDSVGIICVYEFVHSLLVQWMMVFLLRTVQSELFIQMFCETGEYPQGRNVSL